MHLTVQEKNSYFSLREKSRATRDHLGFCVGTEGGKCRTNQCEFAWEMERRKQAVMRKQIKPPPSRSLRERRGTPLLEALHCSQQKLQLPVTRSALPHSPPGKQALQAWGRFWIAV